MGSKKTPEHSICIRVIKWGRDNTSCQLQEILLKLPVRMYLYHMSTYLVIQRTGSRQKIQMLTSGFWCRTIPPSKDSVLHSAEEVARNLRMHNVMLSISFRFILECWTNLLSHCNLSNTLQKFWRYNKVYLGELVPLEILGDHFRGLTRGVLPRSHLMIKHCIK